MKIYSAGGQEKRGDWVARGDESFRHAGGSGLEMWYIANCVNALALTTGAATANVLRALPFVAPARGGTLDRLAFNVTTLLAGNARIGLYKNVSESNLYPQTLLFDSGDISTATAGVKTASLAQDLEPGALYWVAIVGSAAATMRALAVGGCSHILGTTNALGTAPTVGISVAHAYGALPATFTGGGAAITAVPIPALAYRFSA